MDDSQQGGKSENPLEMVIGIVLITFSVIAAFALLHDQLGVVFGR
jgi:hypothetical protein